MGTARVLQVTFDPAQSLLREGFNVAALPVSKQLHQSSAEQLRSASISVAFELMPLPIINAQQVVQLPAVGQSRVGPINAVGTHCVCRTGL